MMRRIGTRVIGSALLLLAVVACAPGSGGAPASGSAPASASSAKPAGGAAAASQAPSGGLQALIEGARREGQLTLIWGENTAGGNEGVRRWAEGFNKLYGLNVNFQFTPGPAMPEVAARVANEFLAGRTASTDILIGSETHIISGMQAGALESVDWQSWAPNVQDPRIVAPDGVAVELASRVPGITYNTNRVRADTVPASLQDVLKPEFKGRIASTPYAANFDRLASNELWGEQRMLDYARALADQITGLMRCGEVDRIMTGEFDMLVMDCGNYDALRLKAVGAPAGHVIPSDAALIPYWYLAVPKNAAHPNAAKLFINYALSREGQDILYDLDYTDHHLLPGSKSAAVIRDAEARGVKFTELNVQFVQRNDERQTARMRDEIQRILQKK